MGILKQNVEDLIQYGNREEALKALEQYEMSNPFDADLISMRTVFHLLYNEIEQAYKYAQEGVRRLPLNGEMQYNLSCIYEQLGKVFEAYICYIRAGFIFQYTGDDNLISLEPFNKADNLIKKITEYSNISFPICRTIDFRQTG